MAARWTASIVWAALAASLVFWGLRLSGAGMAVPAHARAVDAAQGVRGDALGLFATTGVTESAAPAPEAAARFRLIGVVAPSTAGAPGWALIGVDGKAARALAQGQPVDGDWIVQSVAQNRVALGPRGAAAAAVLELATLPAAATGLLTQSLNGAPAAAVATLPVPATDPSAAPLPVPGSVNLGRLPGGVSQSRPMPGMPARAEAASTASGDAPPGEGLNTPSPR